MSEIVRFGVIGGGVMGKNHMRTLPGVPGAELTAVAEPDNERRTEIGGIYKGVKVVGEPGELMDEVDALVIASPSQYHYEQATEALEAGKHVLIEKPVADDSIEHIEALDMLAQRMGRTAMVGHIELFNPTFDALVRLTEDRHIREIDFRRVGTVPPESRLYHDVVRDLMVHDIALALRLLERNGVDTTQVRIDYARGRSDTSAAPDPAEAGISVNGLNMRFYASRAWPAGKERIIQVNTADDEMIEADLIGRGLKRRFVTPPQAGPGGVIEQDVRERRYSPQESAQPLDRELRHMVASIKGLSTPEEAGVSLQHAVRVMKVTFGILDVIRDKR